MKKVFFFLLAVLLILLTGCGEPTLHTNPMDPLCPWSDITVKGMVYSLSGRGISSASLHFLSSDITVFCDDSGYYYADGLLPQEDTVVVEAEGYKTDSLIMDFQPGDKLQKNFILFFIPVIDSQKVYSYNLKYSSPTEKNGVICDLYITDRDRIMDIADVKLKYGYNIMTINDHIMLNDYSAVYRADITQDNSNISVFDMVGLNFVPVVKDYEDIVTIGTGGHLVRVIENIPDILYPEEGDYLYKGDTIKWHVTVPSFSAVVDVNIMRNDSLIWQEKNLSPSDSMYVFDDILPSGTYQLRIILRDEYGDWGARQIWFVSE
jgi:hypothetical protein